MRVPHCEMLSALFVRISHSLLLIGTDAAGVRGSVCVCVYAYMYVGIYLCTYYIYAYYYYYYYYYHHHWCCCCRPSRRQLSCNSVAVVVTLVQTKQIRINIHKRNSTKNTVQTIQNTVNTSTHITKTPTHYKTPTYTHTHTHPHITKQVKTTTVLKWSPYNQVPSV